MCLLVRQNGEIEMRKNPYITNILLIVITGAACLLHLLVSTFCPGYILPDISIPMLVLLSVTALVSEYYLVKEIERNRVVSASIAALTFAVLPACIGWNKALPMWKLFFIGFAVFFVTDILFEAISEKIYSGPRAIFSLIANGFILYLASQCLQGLL